MEWKPDVTVAAIVEDNGRFLIVEETVSGRIVLNQPAGHLESGETLADAVTRETLEETAWRFTPEAITGIYLWNHPTKTKTILRITFCGRVSNHDPDRSLDEGIRRALWLTREEILERSESLRSPMVLRGIDDFLDGARYPLVMISSVDQAVQQAIAL